MSKSQINTFKSIKALSTEFWSVEDFKSWKWRDRSMETVMQRFIDLNKKNLSYLGITTSIETVDYKLKLKIVTSNFIGVIPIISPMTGKPIGDLSVIGRFEEEAEELISLLNDVIKPEYSEELHLVQDSQTSPPIFVECCKYLDTYTEAEKYKWKKFVNEIKLQNQPTSSTLWGEYAQRVACNPLDFSKFKNKCNILAIDHPEWAQLNYVLKIAINELESQRAPQRTRFLYEERISQIKHSLQDKKIQPTKEIKIRMSDPSVIRKLKELARLILNNEVNEKVAWRIDFSEYFERFVQYIFTDVAKRKGAKAVNNPHYNVSAYNRPSWALNYLEPDLILQKGYEQIVVDAKYKRHVLNWNDNSEVLKETFRHDFHQILAYCSLSVMNRKQAMLVYPFSDFSYHKMTVNNPYTHSDVNVYLVGIPLIRNKINEVKTQLNGILCFDELH